MTLQQEYSRLWNLIDERAEQLMHSAPKKVNGMFEYDVLGDGSEILKSANIFTRPDLEFFSVLVNQALYRVEARNRGIAPLSTENGDAR